MSHHKITKSIKDQDNMAPLMSTSPIEIFSNRNCLNKMQNIELKITIKNMIRKFKEIKEDTNKYLKLTGQKLTCNCSSRKHKQGNSIMNPMQNLKLNYKRRFRTTEENSTLLRCENQDAMKDLGYLDILLFIFHISPNLLS